jgi:hypothetical protein
MAHDVFAVTRQWGQQRERDHLHTDRDRDLNAHADGDRHTNA